MHTTYCNPMNLNYRFQVREWPGECLREAGDPTVVRYRGGYWLFASKSGGYWRSPDLWSWSFIPTHVLPTENYAPDVCVIDDALVFTATGSDGATPVWRSTAPERDVWQPLDSLPVVGDPHLFRDDDGRVYLYSGCSSKKPIKGVELDPRTLHVIGLPVDLMMPDVARHGWERGGESCCRDTSHFIEGAWMNRVQDRYVLQYAGPGTLWNVYADGAAEASVPLGPFTCAEHTPFSLKPGGFITGAGHGSTFWDTYGNLWHTATMRISVKHKFERRIGLFPAGFDEDGVLFCNTSFGDYPTRLPDRRWDPWRDAFAGWFLLSRNKPVSVSSSLPEHPPSHAVDEDIRTYWSAESGDEGEWISVDLGGVSRVHAVQINFAEHQCRQYGREGEPLFHQYLLEGTVEQGEWFILVDKREHRQDVPHDYVELPEGRAVRYLRLTNRHMPGHGYVAVSGLRVFGLGAVQPPCAVADVDAALETEALTARVSWADAKGADGYNVRWGPSPDKLYSSWMVYDRTDLVIRTVNRGVRYWLAVDAFNAGGLTPGAVVPVKPS